MYLSSASLRAFSRVFAGRGAVVVLADASEAAVPVVQLTTHTPLVSGVEQGTTTKEVNLALRQTVPAERCGTCCRPATWRR
jgi:hypothetical protein